MKIGIVGAGMTGLSAALELLNKGHEVEIIESSDKIGGIAGAFKYENTYLEKYYHHFFKSDKHIMKLMKEIDLYDEIQWHISKMGFFSGGRTFDFGTPISLLKFKPLPFMDKMKFGLTILKLMGTKDYRSFEGITAHEWIQKHAGKRVYENVWKPLLVSKFEGQYKDISMSWFWGKIKLRGSSKEKGKEALGYIKGSTKTLLDRLELILNEKGANIVLNCPVKNIDKRESIILSTACGEFSYDAVICTTPLPVFLKLSEGILPKNYREEKSNIEYTSVVCTILTLDKPFTGYYWLNMGDESIPFGGLIEHTNLLDKKLYGNNNILYISDYLFKDNKRYNMNDEELLEEYLPHLKKINPEFNKDMIKNMTVFKDEYAQPLIKLGYSKIKPGFETPVKGLYTASMCNIYPEDRGMNYAIREGINAALWAIKGGEKDGK
ncbi:15-cis-phytoene desaturase [Oxobacter pfennigii]|uniref:15-cis-phytoene desaturase n=1 Tax=Oxobacter pfennigii TaxID=36849 RepID=A0A0N8NTZ8_9CLOT|nr:NAD(P)/FAD-dependent oxidoreductase [Oxobacter pfennigii]KPU46232.1 15-cis-phytoene desaturase [Oxobacter pfennigii]